MDAFDELVSAEPLDLERGALLIAKDAYPGLRVVDELRRLDALAASVHLGTPSSAPLPASVSRDDIARALARELHDRLGFTGNVGDYGDVRNSYLNDVLTRRTGLPITLSLVWLAVLKRHGIDAAGVGFPGHFLVRIERPSGGPVIVDPFHGGRQMTPAMLATLLQRSAGPHATLQLSHLAPATPRSILVRMLSNLRGAHLARGDLRSALLVATRTRTLLPREAWPLRDLGVLHGKLGAPAAARAALIHYLEMEPEASDAPAIRAFLDKLAETKRAPN